MGENQFVKKKKRQEREKQFQAVIIIIQLGRHLFVLYF